MFFLSLIAFALATLSLASPLPSTGIDKRGHHSSHSDHSTGQEIFIHEELSSKDIEVVNYALTAEHLEFAFYDEFLAKFDEKDFVDAGFLKDARSRLVEILSHERQHVQLLTDALLMTGATPVKACKYNFPVKTVNDFVTLARVMENAGISLYSGASGLLSSVGMSSIAGTILSIEARQSTYLRHLILPDPVPSSFDTPLLPTQIASIAQGFTVSCPASNPPLEGLGIKKLPSLTASAMLSKPIAPGDKFKVDSKVLDEYEGEEVYAIFLSERFAFAEKVKHGRVKVPQGVASGQTYLFLSSSAKFDASNDDHALTGLAVIEVQEGQGN